MSATPITPGDARFNSVARDLKQLRDVSNRVVGSVFYGTMLKAMRDSKIKGAYGHGGRGEEVFAAQLHGLYAERLGAAQSGGLQEALYRSLEHQQRAMSESYARRNDATRTGVGQPVRSGG